MTAIPHTVILPLASGFVLLWLAHVQRLPLWLSMVAILTCAWSTGQHYRWWRPLPKAWRFILMVVLVGVFIATHLQHFTVETAAAFFMLTVAFKWTELDRPRDVFVMVMILCYLAAVTFLFEQGVLWTLAVMLAVMVLFASLRALAGGARVGGFKAWQSLGWTFLKVLPVVVVLFLVFPRLGPLWSVPLVSDRGSTGLSESMTPGDFADLGQSGGRAFRVSFGGAFPDPSERYWRGLILDEFDGATWSRSTHASGQSLGRVNRSEGVGGLKAGEYEVLMEPSFQPWGYALGGSVPVTGNVALSEHGLVRFSRPIDTVVRYRMRASDKNTLAPVNAELRARYTALPRGFNPQTRAWAQQLASESDSERAFIANVMSRFRELPFFYTLQPAPTGTHGIDDFLFRTREGFCAHYAGALAFALRSVGIPARVVAGYLGGEPGLNSGYLVVRQYDAHAWVEAWVGTEVKSASGPMSETVPERVPESEASGQWLRLDPTAMVAPERVQENWRQALGEGSTASTSDWATEDFGRLPLLRWAGLRLDAANYYWQRFVVDYQSDTQRSLFGKFPGTPDLAMLGYWTAGFVAAVVGLVGLILVRREQKQVKDPVFRYYVRWQRWLKRRKIPAEPGSTPLQQAEQAAAAFPRHRTVVMGFGRALSRSLYNPVEPVAFGDIERRWQLLRKLPRERRERAP